MRNLSRVCCKLALLSLPILGGISVLLPNPAYAIGEQNGRVEGIITDAQSGVAVPGATVKITSKSLIGGPKTVNTDDNGRYEFVELPPGSYDLEVSYEGVKPMRRRFVARQGQAVPLNIKWSVEMAQQETTVVVEERHITNPDSTQTGTVLTLDSESKVASGRRYQDIVQQVAGVSGESGQGNPNIKGATLLHNRYLVDGLDITDPVTNTFSANINFDSIASVEVLTGGMEAQYNSLGGIINLITNAGGNDWHFDTSFYINNQKLSQPRQFGANLYNNARLFSKLQPGPTQAYLANLNFGGPLVKNKLWVNISFEYNYRETSIPAGPPLNLQHPSELNHRFLIRGKLTYAPSDKHRITLSLSADPAYFSNVDQFNGELAIAEDYQKQGGVFGILQWDYFHSKNVNTNIQAGFQWSTIDFGPQGYFASIDTSGYAGNSLYNKNPANLNYSVLQAQHNNADDGTSWYQGAAIQVDTRYTAQFDPSISVRGRAAGYHDAKFGIQSRFIYHINEVQTLGSDFPAVNGASVVPDPLNPGQFAPGGSVYTDTGSGNNGEAGLCNQKTGSGCFQRTDTPNYSLHQQGFGIGAFAQDKWRPVSWLLILPGLRVDYGQSWNSRGEVVSHLLGFGPRLGFILDLTRDQKTIFSAFYGRSNETLSLLAASGADITGTSVVNQWNQSTKTFDKSFTTGGAGGYRLDPGNYTPPHADEVTASLRREGFANSVVTVDYTYKHFQNIWDTVEINQIWDPTGTRVVGYANKTPQQVLLYTTPDANQRTYQGVDFILESAPGRNFDILASYTLSWLYGSGAEQLGQLTGVTASQFYNPRQYQQYDGFLPEDHRHQIKVRGSYSWQGLTGGFNFGWLSGGVETKSFFNQTDGGYTVRRSPQGTEPTKGNDVTQIAEFRTPDLITMDLRLQFDFHSLIRQHLSLIADLFNVFNLSSATNSGGTGGTRAVENRDVPTYGTINARQTPFRAQFGLRYVY